MINVNTIAQQIEWQTQPLCCRYVLVLFEVLSVQVQEEGLVRDQAAHWALGALGNGQHEVLGVWPERASGAMDWQEVFDDLKNRGVERIRFVVTTEPKDPRAAYPGAAGLPSFGQLLRLGLARVAPRDRRSVAKALSALREAGTARAARVALANLSASPWAARYPAAVESWQAALAQLAPFFALAPGLRRTMLSADEAAQRVHERLIRAIGRRGCFDDREAAASFMEETLRRSEYDLRVRQVVLRARAEGRALGGRPQPSIGALGF